MRKVIPYLIILFISSCSIFEYVGVFDDMFTVEGIIYNIDQEPLESVNIKIISIDASEEHESLSRVGSETLTDNQGAYIVGVICNTSWRENTITKEKTYTNYVQSITLEFSKEGYSTVTKEFVATDLESIYFNEDITLVEES